MEPKQDYAQQQQQQQQQQQLQEQQQPIQPVHTPSQQMVPQQQQQQQPPHQVHQQQQNANLDPRSKDWQFGLFDCFSDMEGCLIAYFLPCMLHGKTMDRMRDPSLQSHDPLNNECMIWGGIQCFTCCGWLYNMVKRTEIRERYGIQGSGGSDCCTSYCCLCCALVQQDREVALRAGHYAPVTQGYQGQKEGMQMPAPGAVHPAQHQQSFPQQSPPPQGQYQSPPQQHVYQQSPPPQQAYQTPPPQQQQQQQYQQQPMQTGIQSPHEQTMPTYPHEGQYGQGQKQ